jgi:hypothetical protein
MSTTPTAGVPAGGLMPGIWFAGPGLSRLPQARTDGVRNQ